VTNVGIAPTLYWNWTDGEDAPAGFFGEFFAKRFEVRLERMQGGEKSRRAERVGRAQRIGKDIDAGEGIF